MAIKLILAMKPECQAMAEGFIKAYGHLSYAESRAVQNYIGDANKLVGMAITELKRTGLDPEDLQDIIDPLSEVVKAKNAGPTQYASRISGAQDEILGIAGLFISKCECSPAKGGPA